MTTTPIRQTQRMDAQSRPGVHPLPARTTEMDLSSFQPLTVEAGTLYNSYESANGCALPSSLQFPGLYAYNEATVSRYKMVEDYLCIVFDDVLAGDYMAAPPLGAYHPQRFERAVAELYRLFHRHGLPLVFWEVPLGMLDRFTCLEGFDAQVRHSPDTSDYVFSRDDFGDGLAKRSSLQALRHLEAHQEPDCRAMGSADRELLLELTRDYYCAYHDCGECIYGCELDAVSRFAEQFDALELQGSVVRCGGRPVGCIVAFLRRDTLFAFSKRSRHGVRGLNEYLNKQLMGMFQGRYRWINYSEDMGSQGLRFYKERLGKHTKQHRFRVAVTPANATGEEAV